MAADELTLVEAVADGLHDEMARDESVLVLGEDVGRSGGVFRATEGLYDAFGGDRVVDTPLTETGIAGAAIGLAASGLRPVAEIQFMGFTYAAMEQLYTLAARLHARSRGHYQCQLVVRAPFGAESVPPICTGSRWRRSSSTIRGSKLSSLARPTMRKAS